MSRVPALALQAMTPRQRELYDAIVGTRGILGGPFALWIRLPDVAEASNRLGNALRVDGTLDRRLFELAILTIARHWTAQYEWALHEGPARVAGLGDATIEALRRGEAPPFADDDERLVYELTTELQTTRTLSDATYARALARFGLELLIETISVIGFYTTAAMMINAFQAPVPGDARPLPPFGGTA